MQINLLKKYFTCVTYERDMYVIHVAHMWDTYDFLMWKKIYIPKNNT